MSEHHEKAEGPSSPNDPHRFDFAHAVREAMKQPERIGPYRILETLGEGGMGLVYLAEQEKPLHRRVALKIIKLGMDTKNVIARFEAEREALALMNHPNVARVFDAGSTEEGRPFFVMEYVPGLPITEYCDRHRLSTEDRLRLFMDVCHAVQHAHQKGIIHRDIKPSNVLVSVQDDKPIPKVIDFGVAKATQQRLTELTVFTEQGHLIGTPGYMSPEQADFTAMDIDTRTDVYSLGVLLYELLVGTLPFDKRFLLAAGLMELQRIIREVDPPKPSTRLSAMGTEKVEIKASDPSRARKEAVPTNHETGPNNDQSSGHTQTHPYQDARPPLPHGRGSDQHGHGADLDPITAVAHRRRTQPATLLRMLRGDLDWVVMKCLEKDRTRRYDTANALAMDVQRFLSSEPVLAGPPGLGYRVRKFVRRNKAGVLVGLFILTGVLTASWLLTASLARESKARRAAEIALASEAAQRTLAEQALTEAEEARTLAEQAQSETAAERDRAESEAESARNERDKTGKYAEFMEETLKGVGPSVALGRDTKMLKELMDGAAKRIDTGELSAVPEAEVRLRLTIGGVYREIAEFDAAGQMLEPAVDLAERVHGHDSAERASALTAYAWWLLLVGRSAEALPRCEEALGMYQRIFPGNHLEVASSLDNVGSCLKGLGRSVEALPQFEQALAMYQRLFPGDHSSVAGTLINVGFCLKSLGRSVEALPRFEEALAMHQRLVSGDHPDVARSLNAVASCLRSLGRSAEALPKFEEALAMDQRLFPGDHPHVAESLNNLADCLTKLGRSTEALLKQEEALAMRQRLFPGDHPAVARSLHNLAGLLKDIGRSSEALPKYEESLDMHQRLFPGDHPDVASSINNLATCLHSLGRSAESLPKYEEALAMNQRLFPGDHPHVATSLNSVAFCLNSLGRFAEALPKYEEALAMYTRVLPSDHQWIGVAEIGKGATLVNLERYPEAKNILLSLWPTIADRADIPKKHKIRCLEALVKLFEGLEIIEPGQGHAAEAAKWRAKLENWKLETGN